jgi:hypothetical protein
VYYEKLKSTKIEETVVTGGSMSDQEGTINQPVEASS